MANKVVVCFTWNARCYLLWKFAENKALIFVILREKFQKSLTVSLTLERYLTLTL